MRWVLLALVMLECSPDVAKPADVHLPEIPSLLASWAGRAERLSTIELKWRPCAKVGSNRFARNGSEWLTDEEQPHSRMCIDGVRIVYHGRRVVVRPHGYDPESVKSITASVGAAYPERVGAPYMRALVARFADPVAEARPVQPFVRSYDGALLRDDWLASGDAYPKGVLYSPVEYGSAHWALFEWEQEPDEQLQTLEIMAALLAVQPLHPLVGMRPENLGVTGTANVDAAMCTVLTERPGNGSVRRVLFVDQDSSVVRRYIGETSEAGVQLDIAYERQSAGDAIPSAWTVLRFRATGRPVQKYARAEVECDVSADSLQPGDLPGEFRAGTWVVDQLAQESFLVRKNGERRLVTSDELRWLPTYDELAQTDSGQVGVFIQERLRRREVWQTVRWPVALAAMLLLAAGVQRWWRRASRVQS